MQTIIQDRRMRAVIIIAISLLSLLLLVASLVGMKVFGTVGEGIAASNTISVTGTGSTYANPDVAQVTFDVMSEQSTVAAAQTAVTTKMNAILAYLKTQGIADSDIQTTGYNINPRYNYVTAGTICPVGSYCTQPSGTQTLAGYDVTDSVTLSIRDLSNVGTIFAGLGSQGVTNLNGPNFTVENPDTAQNAAQQAAITDARSKAEALASQLGVHLVRVVGFSNSNNGPVYYAKAMDAMAGGATASAPTPVIPVGQNKITADVTITYEIR